MSAEKIMAAWKKKSFKPVYWLEGDEDYYIDSLMNYAEHELLPADEASFNLTVFYGRDAEFASVMNACKRYPMFAEKQVVLLKEAQHMKEIDKLEAYVSAPLASTIFIVAYKGKSLDKRTKLYKLLQTHSEYLKTAKLEGKIAEWITELVQSKGYSIRSKSVALLEEHIGNDLSRIANEIDKISINLKDKKEIDEDDIEKYIGISKEYNVFELQAAITKKDLPKAITILNYFASNPKLVPIQMALPALYANISKVYAVYGMTDKSDNALKPVFYFNPVALSQAKEMMKNYGFDGIERLLLLLHHYNLKSIGIADGGNSGPSLMKEMILKMML
ncbi:MAG: holA [Ferruginibacter sp.]|nr:holA [Ferruginibacter sp.]